MNDRTRRVLEMLNRVDQYGQTRTSVYPQTSRAGELFATVRTAITRIENRLLVQTASAQSAKQQTNTKADIHKQLIEMMEAISLTARVMARSVPGVEDKFRMPQKMTAQTVLVAARVFAQNAPAFKDEFIRREMPATFIEDLNLLLANYSTALNEHDKQRGARVAATEGTEVDTEEGLAAVRELDAIIRNKVRDDRAELAEWQSACHLERRARRAKAAPNHEEKTPSTGDDPGDSKT